MKNESYGQLKFEYKEDVTELGKEIVTVFTKLPSKDFPKLIELLKKLDEKCEGEIK